VTFLAPQLDVPPPDHTPLMDSTLLAGDSLTVSALSVLNVYAPVFVVAFIVALLATPLARYIALRSGVVDQPDDARKVHRRPTPYLGGIAIFIALMVAIGMSYLPGEDGIVQAPVPLAVVIGMVAITFTGLADDVWGWDPRLKIAGQLVAAAGLAISNVGVDVAVGLLQPFMGAGHEPLFGTVEAPFALAGRVILNGDLYYWVGTAIVAIFVLGGCNAANFIDGLDGLLTGVVAIAAVGLLTISLITAPEISAAAEGGGDSLAGPRLVLCLALLGATLGFLPHNFNPATIFLGDSGSLLLGFMCVVIILMFGEAGRSHLVFAGLIVFGLPIMDTTLAIIRRRLAGVPMSAADRHHLHHQLLRHLGGVKRAVLVLYLIGAAFAALGIALAALVMLTELRVRIVYSIALVLFGFVGVIAVKEAQRQRSGVAPASRAVRRPGGAAAEPGSSTDPAHSSSKAGVDSPSSVTR
jgi:UDP-GlcNAc:undecaprenyl-phosphate GlcNAc-1-phosphate transferase